MSMLSEMMYGPLVDVEYHLNSNNPTLSETQGALINAIGHIRELERRLAKLERYLEDDRG